MSIKRLFSINNIVKLICSLPVILVVLYFIPVLGVLMFIARYFIYGKNHFFRAPITLIIIGLICLAPRGLNSAIQTFHLPFTVPYLSEIVGHDLYLKLAEYGKFIFIFGVVALIASYLLRNLIESISNWVSRLAGEYTSAKHKEDLEIRKENDLKLREKEITSKQKTPHVVTCPSCGTANSITGTIGTCKSCRKPIEWHDKK